MQLDSINGDADTQRPLINTDTRGLPAALRAGDTLAAARAYRVLGVSVFPVRLGGLKGPAVSTWLPYRDRHATDAEATSWWGGRRPCGIAAVGGPISGNLAVLDFETWRAFDQ